MSGRVRCLVCGRGFLKPADVEEKMYGISLGTYHGEVWDKCGETFLKGEEPSFPVSRPSWLSCDSTSNWGELTD